MVAENQEDARILGKRCRMIDPKRRNRGGEKQQRDHKTLGRLRLLAAENQKGQAGDESCENDHFHEARILETSQQFIASPATTLFFGSQSALQKSSAS